MRFSLKSPCTQCPFRSDITPFITGERADEIVNAVLVEEKTFTCHKALNGEWNDSTIGEGEECYSPSAKDIHCAGALVLITRNGAPHRMLQLAERLGLYDPSDLNMAAPVYESGSAMIEAHFAEAKRS